MVSQNVAETYTDIGDFDAALALLGPKAPVEQLAQTLFRAKRSRELKVLLKSVKAPATAARVAWFCVLKE